MCQGVISNNLKIVFLKLNPYSVKLNVIITTLKFIDIGKELCEHCDKIHDNAKPCI